MTSERNPERGFMYQRKKIKKRVPIETEYLTIENRSVKFCIFPIYVRLPKTLAKKNPNNITLHIEIKNSASETSRYIFNRTLS